VKDQLEALVAQMYSSGILYSEAVREFKKRFIMNVLQQNKGNQCKAARELGMHRSSATWDAVPFAAKKPCRWTSWRKKLFAE
jgi:DNA-binding protein Fis